MSRRTTRPARLVALLALPGLLLAALPAATAATAPSPWSEARDYLADDLADGVLTYQRLGTSYDDYDASIDAAVALDAVGGHDAEVQAVATAVSSHLADYTDTTRVVGGSTVTNRSAERTAKAIIVLQAAGRDPRMHPDGDLVARLEGMLVPGDLFGQRIADVATKDGVADPSGDRADNRGQAYALIALTRARSSHVKDVADFLVHQECGDRGYFPAEFVVTNQGCAHPRSASNDTLALAVLAFAPLYYDDDVGSEAAYVLTTALNNFAANGSDTGGGFADKPGTAPNASTTALVVVAMRRLSDVQVSFEDWADMVAARGGAWLRSHQLDNVGSCRPYAAADLGAVAPDDAARSAAVGQGITTTTRGTFVRATVLAPDALLSAPATPSQLRARTVTTYVADGSTQRITLSGATPGSAICLATGKVQRSSTASGAAAFSVRVPARTASTTYTFTAVDGHRTSTVIRSLAAKRLGLQLRAEVASGTSQRVVVSGLARGEKVAVRLQGRTVKRGTADSHGVYRASFEVAGSAGARTVAVAGQFSDRTASRRFSVTR